MQQATCVVQSQGREPHRCPGHYASVYNVAYQYIDRSGAHLICGSVSQTSPQIDTVRYFRQ